MTVKVNQLNRAQKLKNLQESVPSRISENGTGGERKRISFRPYEDTRQILNQLALDLTGATGKLVKVHDLMIEAVNDLLAKYGVDHIAQRPDRKKRTELTGREPA